MSNQDLTSLSALKAWLGLPSAASPSDAAMAALVTATSRAVYAALGRPGLLPQTFTETIDFETRRVFLRNWPVLSVASVTIEGLPVPPVQAGMAAPFGYRLGPADAAPPGRPQAMDLFGCRPRPAERQALTIAYSAGYAVVREAQSVPLASPFSLTALAPYGAWAGDLGAVYAASGASLTAAANPSAAGQYSAANGLYAFSAADAGAPVLLSYAFVPQDIAQATLEWAAERFRAADRIGLRSKSVGGQETISYDTGAVSASVLALLQPYRRTLI